MKGSVGLAEIKIEDIIFEISSPIAEKNNCEVVDVEFKKEGANWFLRIFIDKDGGIMIDDCEAVSRGVSDELDKVDPISQAYFLEVSSPGIYRILKRDKDFIKYKGYNIEVKLYKPLEGKKKLKGILADFKNDIIYIEIESGEIIEINKKDSGKVTLADD